MSFKFRVTNYCFCSMDRRVLLLLVALSSCWCCNARDLTVLQSNDKGEALYVQEVTKNEDFCALCEEFASEALSYLTLNKTQAEIITILHKSCPGYLPSRYLFEYHFFLRV
ncbi:uncharacterized protein LOC131002654 [Salvia miltiorrhiza]|uniref:uncharacterized protein LOC131002654 n=1 Tax=Salvia miltiorrhiza TaxID=226208 RepID=UPI0025ABB852|nr:uncharacterized protein LOC131002654 [Salvia miltiorrhiza]